LHARHFADFGDVAEDPFTGSATGGMAGYVARYGIVTETQFRVAQGMHVNRPGAADVYVGGLPPGDIGRITVAGSAVTVMKGMLSLP
jgi:trans-2,3-dihydro-3-hydroxyanthranilate isomerase